MGADGDPIVHEGGTSVEASVAAFMRCYLRSDVGAAGWPGAPSTCTRRAWLSQRDCAATGETRMQRVSSSLMPLLSAIGILVLVAGCDAGSSGNRAAGASQPAQGPSAAATSAPAAPAAQATTAPAGQSAQ